MARIAQNHSSAFQLRPGETRCPACHGTDFESTLRLKSHDVGRCLGCGLMVNISFPQAAPETVFNSAYHGDAQSAAFARDEYGKTDASGLTWRAGLDALARTTPGRRLLDVGSARGSFVALALASGWDAQGVEFSDAAAQIAREEHGVPVRTGTLDAIPETERFDAITIWDVLEHVTDVSHTLNAARARLKPDGALLITTDNFDSLVADLGRSAYAVTRGRLTFPVERFFIPYNTVYFTPESLRSSLLVAGLTTTYSQGIDYPLEKMNLSVLQRMVTKMLYATGQATGRQSQMLVIAQPTTGS